MARKAKAKDATVIDASAYNYGKTRVHDKAGKVLTSTGNGDAVQRAMLKFKASGKDIGQVIRANKLPQDPAKYDNLGLLRMSVGNSLRALVKAGTHAVIGDVTVKSLDQRVALDEVKDGAAPKASTNKAKKATKAKRSRKSTAAVSEEATA